MTVTILFKSKDGSKHTGQAFQVTSWEVHTYNFLELKMVDGSCQHFNLEDVFSFQVVTAPVVSAKKK